ncbi:hypothetical protein [Kordiimonas marina]|uniref:hypothetical protein n=1 Tax=Kordiimonas marina TaxID=2872312 RepID=UPI001FF49896|nr:hypothetical protein [Kordiimonas marina]MCJ9430669.1 hypothetical protein [Kordiimonas marina]
MIGVFVFLVAWNRGTYVVLTSDALVYRRFFLLNAVIQREDIAKATAIAQFEIRAGKLPFRVELYREAEKQPVFLINLKPFPLEAIEQLFEWLPNLDRSKFKTRLVSDDI